MAMLVCIGLAPPFLPLASLAQANVTGQQSRAPAPTLKITLMDALERAKAMSPALRKALENVKIAGEDKTQARALNLPTVSAISQYLYTQGNGTPAARFIANNGVHEYIAQADAHQVLSATQVVQYRQSIVMETLARDQAAIAQRGLVVTVVQSYAMLVAANQKYATLEQATVAARNFASTTQQLETGGEVAHADVVKARIQLEDSEVALEGGQLALEQARVSLALLLFQDVNQNFELVDDPTQFLLIPAFGEAQAEAQRGNPTIGAALDTERAASENVTLARTGYLPTLTLDYFYGIDANHFATETPSLNSSIQNLGYSAWASLNLPIWNWGATRSRVKQAEYRKHQALIDLQFAQRQVTSELKSFYSEVTIAKSQMDTLQRSAADAQESLDLTLLQYRAGHATALEVVNAEATLSLERNAYSDAQTRYATALAKLATLTGTL